jgi:hypothetical protein
MTSSGLGHEAALFLGAALRHSSLPTSSRHKLIARDRRGSFLDLPLGKFGLVHIHAAVDADGLPGHKIAIVGSKKNYRAD